MGESGSRGGRTHLPMGQRTGRFEPRELRPHGAIRPGAWSAGTSTALPAHHLFCAGRTASVTPVSLL